MQNECISPALSSFSLNIFYCLRKQIWGLGTSYDNINFPSPSRIQYITWQWQKKRTIYYIRRSRSRSQKRRKRRQEEEEFP